MMENGEELEDLLERFDKARRSVGRCAMVSFGSVEVDPDCNFVYCKMSYSEFITFLRTVDDHH
jgi:hypothetical protein